MIKECPNKLQLITNTPRPAFNLQYTEYRTRELGEIFERKFSATIMPEQPSKINTTLMTLGVCIHITAFGEKYNMGFCYELLVPPNPVPKYWHFNLTPSHKLDVTNTRSLQIGMAGALDLVKKREETHNHSYLITLSPTAWKQYQNNMHVYPTRGYSLLFKPRIDAFKLLEQARRNVRSTLIELDVEDFLIEDRGKCFLPEYLDKTFTSDKNKRCKNAHV